MEITLEAILSAIGLLTGGGFGTFFTWRYFKRKAKADAESAEAEAKQKAAEAEQARIEANKQFQEMYKTMFEDIKQNYDEKQGIIDELRRDRDHFKEERDELREKVEKLQKSIFEWKQQADNDRSETNMKVARLGRKVEMMAPFMCGDLSCKLRQRVTISDEGEIKKRGQKKPSVAVPPGLTKEDIEPINEEL